MNKLPREKRAQILHMLVEGNSLRAVTRMTGVSINTVTKLLIDAGKACAEYQDRAFRNLSCRRIQVDEIWSFTYSKQKNVAAAKRKDLAYGDTWTWTAICADTKLIPSWLVGGRDSDYAMAFMDDLARRLAHRVQLTSDGHKAYLEAVEGAFGGDVDYAMLVKLYGTAPEAAKGRYSPAECIGARKTPVEGNPDPDHVSTSYAERQNLTMRMHMRRFTRLTNAFSKKVENHAHAVALHFMYYNFVRIHKSLRTTPAQAAGVTEKLWEIGDIADLVEAAEPAPKKRGPYKKQGAIPA
jgi:IS1 family transposase